MEADYILDYNAIPEAREYQFYLMARLKAVPALASDSPPPLSLAIVLDRSGSMEGAKLRNVKKATELVLPYLGARDWLSLVTYNHEVTVDVPPGPVTQLHKEEVIRAVKAVRAEGDTNLSGGWLQGCQLVQAEKDGEGVVSRVWQKISGKDKPVKPEGVEPGRIKRVLLLTDGLANRGVTETSRLAALTRQKQAEGISTTTVGVGLDFDEDLLTGMATHGGGNFYFADDIINADQTTAIFSKELEGLLQVVGQNLVITVMPSSEIAQVKQLNSYPLEKRESEVVFRLGDLHATETKTLTLEMTTKGVEKLGQLELGRLRFEYDELGQEQVNHRVVDLPITLLVVSEEVFKDQPPNGEVRKIVLLLRATQARQQAIGLADQGNFEQAKQILSNIADDIYEANLEDVELRAEVDKLREEAIDMEIGAERYNAYARKTSMATLTLTGTGQLGSYKETMDLYSRLKRSRQAIERHGETPTSVTYHRQKLDLTMDLLRIGRSSQNYIVIPEKEVSKYHCQIMREDNDLILVDLNSTNGTFANGGRITDRFRLSTGDVVTVGSWSFMFQ